MEVATQNPFNARSLFPPQNITFLVLHAGERIPISKKLEKHLPWNSLSPCIAAIHRGLNRLEPSKLTQWGRKDSKVKSLSKGCFKTLIEIDLMGSCNNLLNLLNIKISHTLFHMDDCTQELHLKHIWDYNIPKSNIRCWAEVKVPKKAWNLGH